jgi:hypothetical protein
VSDPNKIPISQSFETIDQRKEGSKIKQLTANHRSGLDGIDNLCCQPNPGGRMKKCGALESFPSIKFGPLQIGFGLRFE